MMDCRVASLLAVTYERFKIPVALLRLKIANRLRPLFPQQQEMFIDSYITNPSIFIFNSLLLSSYPQQIGSKTK